MPDVASQEREEGAGPAVSPKLHRPLEYVALCTFVASALVKYTAVIEQIATAWAFPALSCPYPTNLRRYKALEWDNG